MKILITGAAGFLGLELVSQLGNDHELFCITRNVSKNLPSKPSINWIEMNLSVGLNRAKLPKKLDAIIHLAQSNGYRNFPSEAGDVFAVNISLVQQLCEYGVDAGILSMVLASTGTVYEPFKGEMRESDALRPIGYYGASKLSAELISESYQDLFSVCNLRVFFLYGQGQKNMLVARLIENVKSGTKVTLPKDCEGLVFVPTYVSDTAKVFRAAIEAKWRGPYNVASPHKISLGGLLRTISIVTGKPLNLELTDAESPAPIVPNLDTIGTMVDLNSFLTPKLGIAKSV